MTASQFTPDRGAFGVGVGHARASSDAPFAAPVRASRRRVWMKFRGEAPLETQERMEVWGPRLNSKSLRVGSVNQVRRGLKDPVRVAKQREPSDMLLVRASSGCATRTSHGGPNVNPRHAGRAEFTTIVLGRRAAVALGGSALCLVALTGCRSGPSLFVPSPSGQHPWVTPMETRPKQGLDNGPCPACSSRPAWAGMATKPVLVAALKAAYDQLPPVRPLVERAASSGVHIVIAPPDDPDSLGVFDGNTHLIRLAPSVLNEPAAVVAAVLVHEIVHANEPYEPGAEACYSHEVVAYSWQAETYEALRTGHETTPLARFQAQLVDAWHAGRLDALVHSFPLYSRQCVGRR